MHIVDDSVFVFPLPLILQEQGDKVDDSVVIFSLWNLMVGTTIVTMPWAFQQSGMILGFIIALCSFIISYYTTTLVVSSAGNDPDFCITLKKYYGNVGYYAGVGSNLLVMLGA